MTVRRLEAFFDAVVAILITLMALELKVPTEPTYAAVAYVIPDFITYVISFTFIGIFWINHHHLFSIAKDATTKLIWTNIIFLFFLSLIPVLTMWVTEFNFAHVPVLFYGINIYICIVIYQILLQEVEQNIFGKNHTFLLLKETTRINLSFFLGIIAIGLAVFSDQAYISFGIYILILFTWLVPSTVFQSYHEVVAEGKDITNDFEQVKIAFTEREQEKFRKRHIKFRSDVLRNPNKFYFNPKKRMLMRKYRQKVKSYCKTSKKMGDMSKQEFASYNEVMMDYEKSFKDKMNQLGKERQKQSFGEEINNIH